METLSYRIKLRSFIQKIAAIYRSFSPERVLLLWCFVFLSCAFFFSALVTFNNRFLISVPTYGGEVREGITGTPRFINPILATTEQDKDMVSLIFAGLTKKTFDGGVIYDMAESITESEDGLKYSVILKENARFHDGEKVTADDIIFTILKVQNPLIKSPHKVEWEGVTVDKISGREITFSLKKPFPLFLETLSLGIIPKHIWKNLTDEQISLSDLNIKAVGSGPYKIASQKTESGIPISFALQSHKYYTLGRPYVESLVISTYQNEKYLLKAFTDGDISRIHGIAPEKVQTLNVASSSIKTSLLPRTFAIFFNPNKSTPLSDKNVRSGMQLAINKKEIVDTVLNGYGKVISGPYPFDKDDAVTAYDPILAREAILKNKTIKSSASSTYSITLTTANTDEMKKVAEMIKNDWEKIGITTTIKIYDVSDLNQMIIKERDFEVLLFGAITQNPSDLYAFWHSSQRTYPGLNISNYVSKDLDESLEILRSERDLEARNIAYTSLKKEFEEEVPGIFLFTPSLIYVTNDKIKTALPAYSYDNSSRFNFIENWYRYSDRVWPKTYYKPVLEKMYNFIH